jgi:putative MATE family efflux protein
MFVFISTTEAKTTAEPTALAASLPHLRDILHLAGPAILAIASEPLLNIADTAMIGRLGVDPLAARAIGSALIGGVYWAFTFLVFGTTTLVGFHHGANDDAACAETWLHALFLALIGGVSVTIVGFLLAPILYQVMGADEAVVRLGVPYFRLRIASATFTFVFFATVGFFRGIQDTRTPMLVALIINGLNLVLDYGLIYGSFGFPALALQGAAAAAWISQGIGAAICIGLFLFSSRSVRYRQSHWRINPSRLRPLFRIGRDLAVRTGALRFSLVFATGSAARMGTTSLAAHEIAFQLLMLSSDVTDGLAVAGQALASKHLGSGRIERAYRMGKTLILCGGVAGLLFAATFFLGQNAIVRLFTTSSEVMLLLGGTLILLVALFQPANGIVFVLDGFLIGAHDTRFLMWAMLVGALCLFVPLSWLSLQQGWGLMGIWTGVSMLMTWRLVTNVYRFKSQKWAPGIASRNQ